MLRKNLYRLATVCTELTHFRRFSENELKQMLKRPNQLREVMVDQIRTFGQLKMDKYWNLALTDPQYGYYRKGNVFSTEGDFTTSPEISPLFGEMVTTWIVYFLQTVKIMRGETGSLNRNVRIIQLGAGRGLLMRDIVRLFRDFKIDNHFEINFVEISEYNRKEQQKQVMNEFKKSNLYFNYDHESKNEQLELFMSENSQKDITLKWFTDIEQIVVQDHQSKMTGKQLPFTVFVMNQYFDALPTMILEFTKDGWREKVLTLSKDPNLPLQLTNSMYSIPEKMTPKIVNPQIGDYMQVSPMSLVTIDLMAKMIKLCGGAILNIDYGESFAFSDSIRAIMKHKYVDSPYFWQVPGTCDLSAYVDFASLARFAEMTPGVRAFEAIPQGYFLEAMGINARIEMLSKNSKPSKIDRLESEYKRLVSKEEMGEIYKVQIITLKEYGEIYPHITSDPNVF